MQIIYIKLNFERFCTGGEHKYDEHAATHCTVQTLQDFVVLSEK